LGKVQLEFYTTIISNLAIYPIELKPENCRI
jgi:hypothetical protein